MSTALEASPAKFSDIKVPVSGGNKHRETKPIIMKGRELGIHVAEVIDEFQEDEGDEQLEEENPSSLENEVVEKMLSNLSDELNEEQRSKVKALLVRHRTIISAGEHDIGRTHLVEHRIDTGERQPIRLPLRRRPF